MLLNVCHSCSPFRLPAFQMDDDVTFVELLGLFYGSLLLHVKRSGQTKDYKNW